MRIYLLNFIDDFEFFYEIFESLSLYADANNQLESQFQFIILNIFITYKYLDVNVKLMQGKETSIKSLFQ